MGVQEHLLPHYARAIRDTRLTLGLTQGDVAESAGCAVSQVCQAERGLLVSLPLQARIGEALGASSGYFWGVA